MVSTVISGRDSRVPLDWNDHPSLLEQANPFAKTNEPAASLLDERDWDDSAYVNKREVPISGPLEPAPLSDRVWDTFDTWQPGMLVLLIPIAFVAVALVFLAQSDAGDQTVFGEDLETSLSTARSGELTVPTIELDGPTADKVPNFPVVEQATPEATDPSDNASGLQVVDAPDNDPSPQDQTPAPTDTSTEGESPEGESTTPTSAPPATTTATTPVFTTTAKPKKLSAKSPKTTAKPTTTTARPKKTTAKPVTTKKSTTTTTRPRQTTTTTTTIRPVSAIPCQLYINRSVNLTKDPRIKAKIVGEAAAGVYSVDTIQNLARTRWYQITANGTTGWVESSSVTSVNPNC